MCVYYSELVRYLAFEFIPRHIIKQSERLSSQICIHHNPESQNTNTNSIKIISLQSISWVAMLKVHNTPLYIQCT